MRSLLRPWALFTLALALGLGAMGWITRTAVRTERAEQEARRRAAQAEKVRLAVWRMDSTMALFLAPEAARPWSDFEAFHPAERAFTRRGPAAGGEVLIPSPFLVTDDSLVLLRFQIEGPGRFTSPLVPAPAHQDLARRIAGMAERRAQAELRLQALQGRMTWDSARKALVRQGGALFTARQMEELQDRAEKRGPGAEGRVRIASPFQVFQLAWTPFWEGDSLFMVRQVWVGGREALQGCWLDWSALKEVLMSTIRDFLPAADLRPAAAGEARDAEGRLSSLPVRLLPGEPEGRAAPLSTPSKAALLAGWAFALLGAAAGALVLYRATLLSERRGAFASAVAHELRTPLTTFRLYTELLAHGMVAGEAERDELHGTLLVEADRLDHLVKNVLAYARLESSRGVNLSDIGAGELLDRVGPRLAERARQSGMALERVEPPELRGWTLHTDALVVEQILYNLVDNACKYAAGAADRRIRLDAAGEDGGLVLRVRDQGPGIPANERKRLFKPFQKLGPKEARSAPGVGLGLALCRRLARMLGGELDYEPGEGGACFALRLPSRT